tara:strand:+ start:20122 stop:21087 length:966 start_codon:yes stop_codon:yes gene_type:complete
VQYKTPILLIIWKRPKATYKLLQVLKKQKPLKVYIACDGPKKNDLDNLNKVKITRDLIKREIDWNTSIKTLYSEENLGCKYGVSKAINWFFQNENEGIILEDDCIPHPDFFEYCEILLEKFREDERIWCISGSNHVGKKIGNESYFFSRYNHCWGWASWKRCWKHYDPEMSLWPKYFSSKLLKTNFPNKKEYYYWKSFFSKFYNRGCDYTWDYQWLFCSLINSGLSVIPNTNLIDNIGFDSDATHTKIGKSPIKVNNIKAGKSGVLPIIHPEFIVRSEIADRIVEIKNFSGPYFLTIKWLKKYQKKIINKIFSLRYIFLEN